MDLLRKCFPVGCLRACRLWCGELKRFCDIHNARFAMINFTVGPVYSADKVHAFGEENVPYDIVQGQSKNQKAYF